MGIAVEVKATGRKRLERIGAGEATEVQNREAEKQMTEQQRWCETGACRRVGSFYQRYARFGKAFIERKAYGVRKCGAVSRPCAGKFICSELGLIEYKEAC